MHNRLQHDFIVVRELGHASDCRGGWVWNDGAIRIETRPRIRAPAEGRGRAQERARQAASHATPLNIRNSTLVWCWWCDKVE